MLKIDRFNAAPAAAAIRIAAIEAMRRAWHITGFTII